MTAPHTIPWRGMKRRALDEWQPPACTWREAAFLGFFPPLVLCLVLWLVDQLSEGRVQDLCLRVTSTDLRLVFLILPLSGAILGILLHFIAKGRRAWSLVESESAGSSITGTALSLFKRIVSPDSYPARVAPAPRLLVLMREWPGAGAAIFLNGISATALIAWRHFHNHLPLLGTPEDILLTWLALAAAMVWRLRRNRFDPRVWRFRLPEWALILADEHVLPQARQTIHSRIQAASVLGADLVFADDLPDFFMPLHSSLPETRRNVGVNVAGDTLRRLRKLNRTAGGRFFQKKAFRGTLAMLDLYRGPVHGAGLLECKRLAAQLISRARAENWRGPTFARHLLAFIQKNIAFHDDETGTGFREYGRFPLQTLLDGEGDCDCSAILCCALLSYCGFESALILSKDHAWCGLRRPDAASPWWHRFSPGRHAQAFWHGETTASDGGEWNTPDDARLASINTVIPIKALPLTGPEEVEETGF